jgi:hypothetical protein
MKGLLRDHSAMMLDEYHSHVDEWHDPREALG